jgi:hypothetical protein
MSSPLLETSGEDTVADGFDGAGGTARLGPGPISGDVVAVAFDVELVNEVLGLTGAARDGMGGPSSFSCNKSTLCLLVTSGSCVGAVWNISSFVAL